MGRIEKGVASSVIALILTIIATVVGAGIYALRGAEGGGGGPSEEELEPAEFEVSNLTVSPSEAEPGGTVTISVDVSNVGDEEGTYSVELSIDGIVEETENVTLDGGVSATASFRIEERHAGTYHVSLAGMAENFRVREEILPANWDETISIGELYENPSQYAATSYEEFEGWLTDPQQFVSNTVLVRGEMEMTGLGEDLSSPLLREVGGVEDIGLGGHDFDMVEDGQNVVLKGLLRYDGESFGMKVEKVFYDLQETREFEIKSWRFENWSLELTYHSPIDGVINLYYSGYKPWSEEKLSYLQLDYLHCVDSGDGTFSSSSLYDLLDTWGAGTYSFVLHKQGVIFGVSQITVNE